MVGLAFRPALDVLDCGRKHGELIVGQVADERPDGLPVGLRVGFANSGGLVFVDESAEEIAAA